MHKLLLYFIFSIFNSLKLSREPIELIKQLVKFAFIIAIIFFGYTYYRDSKDERLLSAASIGDTDGIEAALNSGSRIAANDIVGRTALHLATRYSEEEAVIALLLKGANPDIKDKKGRTPLHIAHFDQKNNIETIKILLKYNANPNILDDNGDTPLDLAIKRRKYSVPISRLLRENGALTSRELKEIWSFKKDKL